MGTDPSLPRRGGDTLLHLSWPSFRPYSCNVKCTLDFLLQWVFCFFSLSCLKQNSLSPSFQIHLPAPSHLPVSDSAYLSLPSVPPLKHLIGHPKPVESFSPFPSCCLDTKALCLWQISVPLSFFSLIHPVHTIANAIFLNVIFPRAFSCPWALRVSHQL